MKQSILTAWALLVLCLATIIMTTQAGRTELAPSSEFEVPTHLTSQVTVAPANFAPELPTTCALQPTTNRTTPNLSSVIAPAQIALSRFRREESEFNASTGELSNPSRGSYKPKESIALADSTNYSDRFLLDLYGKPAYHPPIVVIHETVGSARSAINTFRTRHLQESKQVSYHTLIKRDGEVVYIVPPDKRAFGAGNSVFESEIGLETVKTHPDYPPSVNNFAYHISLETPQDGNNNRSRHSGYTQAQYQSLAWLVAKTGVPYSRITTHQGVDRSGLRKDPRSFDNSRFVGWLKVLPTTQEIVIDCQPPSQS